MMFVDASAIIAIIAQEEDWRSFVDRIDTASVIYLSPLVVWEASVGLARQRACSIEDARQLVERFVTETEARLIAIDQAVGKEALRAWSAYGKGRHPAALNFGDCFAYACARALDMPLLFKGDDFIATDIERA